MQRGHAKDISQARQCSGNYRARLQPILVMQTNAHAVPAAVICYHVQRGRALNWEMSLLQKLANAV